MYTCSGAPSTTITPERLIPNRSATRAPSSDTVIAGWPAAALRRFSSLVGRNRGWKAETVDYWIHNRLGRGARTDLRPR